MVMNTTSLVKKSSICKKDRESGIVYLRDGVTVSFFLPMPLHEIVKPISSVFMEYIKIIPDEVLRWESVGATSEEWRPISKTTISRCLLQLKPEAARKRNLTCFELMDGDKPGDAPGYGITIIGNPVDPELPKEKNLVQMYFPSSHIEADKVDGFVDTICNLASQLPYVSGYVSPGLHWAELFSGEAMQYARKIARRHPGYDVQDNTNGRSDINNMVRGARWLSFLGPMNIDQLGGFEALSKAFVDPITVDQVGHGAMIRAGKEPEIGDVKRQIDSPLLREVANFLKPITLFGEEALIGLDFADPDEDDFLEEWEHRFFN